MAENSGIKRGVFGFLKRSKADDEIQKYVDLLKKDPENERAYIRLSELYARSGEDELAVETYEKAALLFEKKGFLNKAKAVLKQALAINPDHGKVNVLLADLDKQDGLIKDAVLRYQIAANYYAKSGNRRAAINILYKIVDIYPNNINYLLKLANLLVAERENDEVVRLLTPLSVRLKGSARLQERIKVLRLLFTSSGEEFEMGQELVDCYIDGQNYQGALSILHKLVISRPESLPLLEKLSLVFEKLDETEKLISTLKQIAVIYNAQKDLESSNRIYRRVLELDSSDTEALLALNRESKLRDMISSKIDLSQEDLAEDEITIDLELDEIDEASAEVETQDYNASSIIKEALVYKSYRLYDKAFDKLKSFPYWQKDYEVLDALIEVSIESGDPDSARSYMVDLLNLCMEKSDVARARTMLEDVSDVLEGHPDLRRFQDFAGLKITAPTRVEDSLPKEPPQRSLEELEFFVSIEDFSSALILLQDLMVKYPNSEMLKEFKDVIPSRKEEDLSETLEGVKSSLSKTLQEGDKSAEDFYNMGIVHTSMMMVNEAMDYFRQACDLEPQNLKYAVALSDAYRDSGLFEKSLEVAEAALQLAEDGGQRIALFEKIAELYRHLEDTARFNETLRKIKEMKENGK